MARPKVLARAGLADADDTIRVTPPGRSRGLLFALGGIVLAAIIAIGGWFALRPAPFALAGETRIFNHVSPHFTVFRFRPDPRILVVDCPGLHAQGMMFDRIAALIEKNGAPKTRILTQLQFNAVLSAAHQTTGTYYYGNDYPAAALRRFFRLAAAEHEPLTAGEQRLHAIIKREGFLAPGANGAVISIPQAGGKHRVGWRARAVILRHELSHGAYFTLPAYNAYVHHFYNNVMTPAEQAAFQTFLTSQGYDPKVHDLIINETVAYLIFTRDKEFFRASAVGLPPATIETLRAAFEAKMPDFWLKPLATTPLPVHR